MRRKRRQISKSSGVRQGSKPTLKLVDNLSSKTAGVVNSVKISHFRFCFLCYLKDAFFHILMHLFYLKIGQLEGKDDDSDYNQNNFFYFGGGGNDFTVMATGDVVLKRNCSDGETFSGTWH